MDELKQLLDLDVSKYTEKKNGLTYLSWAIAWREFLKVYPDATYAIDKDVDGNCFFGNEKFGYMVYTSVTANDVTRQMWLFVMNGANKSIKDESYTYLDKWKKEKTVDAISMFDINKTVMRCLTKNLAMFGLGLYIYAGEDLPQALPTNISCTDLIEEAVAKGYTAKDAENSLIKHYKHGMEFITKAEHDEALKGWQDVIKKVE